MAWTFDFRRLSVAGGLRPLRFYDKAKQNKTNTAKEHSMSCIHRVQTSTTHVGL